MDYLVLGKVLDALIGLHLTAAAGILHRRQEVPGAVQRVESRGCLEIADLLVAIGVAAEDVDALLHAHHQRSDPLILLRRVQCYKSVYLGNIPYMASLPYFKTFNFSRPDPSRAHPSSYLCSTVLEEL